MFNSNGSVALKFVRRTDRQHHLRTTTHTQLRKHALRMPAHCVNTDGKTSSYCLRRRARGYQSRNVSLALRETPRRRHFRPALLGESRSESDRLLQRFVTRKPKQLRRGRGYVGQLALGIKERGVQAGGTLVMPKTSIGPNGFMAFFIDTEGNCVAVSA